MRSYSIREMADARSLERVVEMSMRFLATTRFGTLVKTTPAQLETLALKVAKLGVVLVAEADELADGFETTREAIGFVALAKLQHPISGKPYADEIAWWVEPEHRQAGVGRLLLERAEAWARENGCSMVKMVAPAGSTIGTFYENCGYVVVETAYQKELT